jgi:hypothetical protein
MADRGLNLRKVVFHPRSPTGYCEKFGDLQLGIGTPKKLAFLRINLKKIGIVICGTGTPGTPKKSADP